MVQVAAGCPSHDVGAELEIISAAMFQEMIRLLNSKYVAQKPPKVSRIGLQLYLVKSATVDKEFNLSLQVSDKSDLFLQGGPRDVQYQVLARSLA